MLMYTREYLIALFFPAQRPYWFVSVLPRNPIPFPYPYFPNPIPFPPKNIETKIKMGFFCLFPSLQARPPELINSTPSTTVCDASGPLAWLWVPVVFLLRPMGSHAGVVASGIFFSAEATATVPAQTRLRRSLTGAPRPAADINVTHARFSMRPPTHSDD